MGHIRLDRDILFSQITFIKILFFSLLLCAGILMGCGSSGDGKSGDKIKSKGGTEDNPPPIDSTDGLNWGDMKWDQGEWG